MALSNLAIPVLATAIALGGCSKNKINDHEPYPKTPVPISDTQNPEAANNKHEEEKEYTWGEDPEKDGLVADQIILKIMANEIFRIGQCLQSSVSITTGEPTDCTSNPIKETLERINKTDMPQKWKNHIIEGVAKELKDLLEGIK